MSLASLTLSETRTEKLFAEERRLTHLADEHFTGAINAVAHRRMRQAVIWATTICPAALALQWEWDLAQRSEGRYWVGLPTVACQHTENNELATAEEFEALHDGGSHIIEAVHMLMSFDFNTEALEHWGVVGDTKTPFVYDLDLTDVRVDAAMVATESNPAREDLVTHSARYAKLGQYVATMLGAHQDWDVAMLEWFAEETQSWHLTSVNSSDAAQRTHWRTIAEFSGWEHDGDYVTTDTEGETA